MVMVIGYLLEDGFLVMGATGKQCAGGSHRINFFDALELVVMSKLIWWVGGVGPGVERMGQSAQITCSVVLVLDKFRYKY